mgnify:CR=1 FL=1
MQKKAKKALSVLEYFTTHQWEFTNDNIFMLINNMSEIDNKIFNFDVRDLNWDHYLESYGIGAKVHLMKEDIKNVGIARQNIARMRRNTKLIVCSILLVLFKLVLNRCKSVRALFKFLFGFALSVAQFVLKRLPIKNI